MRDLLKSDAALALPTMLSAQSIITMAAFAIPVAAPAAAPDIGVPTLYVGGFTSLVYLVGMTAGLFSGTLVGRFGTIRTTQILLLLVAAGIAIFEFATPWAALVCAIAVGAATGPMNPAGSHILARTTPSRWRAFVFSIKQCGTPMGGMLAGVVIPPLLLAFGWQAALSAVWIAALAMILLIQPMRARLDTDRQPSRAFTAGSVVSPLRMVLRHPELRALALMGFAYAGAQVTLASYLVVYLNDSLNMSIGEAGLLYAVFSACGIPVRIIWGVIAERFLRSRTILILTGLLMAIGFALTGHFTVVWPFWLLGAVTVLLGFSANGWVGLFFAEVVRLVPENAAGEASGGAQFFTYGGIMVMPVVFGVVVAATDSYLPAFYVLAVLCLCAAAYLRVPRRTSE